MIRANPPETGSYDYGEAMPGYWDLQVLPLGQLALQEELPEANRGALYLLDLPPKPEYVRPLTPSQLTAMHDVSHGLSHIESAERRHRSPNTQKRHVTDAIDRLLAKNAAEGVAKMVLMGDLHTRRRSWSVGWTARQAEIISYIARGYENVPIGKKVFLSPDRVKDEIGEILEVTGAVDRAHLVRISFEIGTLITPRTIGRRVYNKLRKLAALQGLSSHTPLA